MVVLAHANIALNATFGPNQILGPATSLLNALGHLGVDLFFVISGTIMFMLYGQPGVQTGLQAVATFSWRRFLRIYPLFWMTSIAGVLLGFPTIDQNTSTSLPKQIALLEPPLFNLVGWTLAYEVHFYLLVGCALLLSRQRADLGLLLLACIIPWIVVLAPFPSQPLLNHPLMLEFVLGILVGALVAHHRFDGRITLALGFVGICVGVVTVMPFTSDVNEILQRRFLSFALPCASLLHGLMALERSGQLAVPQWLQAWGDRSYSVYLWHFPILFSSLLPPFPPGLPGVVLMLLSATFLLLLVAELSYRWIERPLMAAARLPGCWPNRHARPATGPANKGSSRFLAAQCPVLSEPQCRPPCGPPH
jgi:exopolysaccharide production protein ExoZ